MIDSEVPVTDQDRFEQTYCIDCRKPIRRSFGDAHAGRCSACHEAPRTPAPSIASRTSGRPSFKEWVEAVNNAARTQGKPITWGLGAREGAWRSGMSPDEFVGQQREPSGPKPPNWKRLRLGLTGFLVVAFFVWLFGDFGDEVRPAGETSPDASSVSAVSSVEIPGAFSVPTLMGKNAAEADSYLGPAYETEDSRTGGVSGTLYWRSYRGGSIEDAQVSFRSSGAYLVVITLDARSSSNLKSHFPGASVVHPVLRSFGLDNGSEGAFGHPDRENSTPTGVSFSNFSIGGRLFQSASVSFGEQITIRAESW